MSMEFSCDCESISSLCSTWFRMFRSIIVRSITQGAGMMAFVAGGKASFKPGAILQVSFRTGCGTSIRAGWPSLPCQCLTTLLQLLEVCCNSAIQITYLFCMANAMLGMPNRILAKVKRPFGRLKGHMKVLRRSLGGARRQMRTWRHDRGSLQLKHAGMQLLLRKR